MENENIYFHGNRPEMAFMIPTDIHKVLEIGCGKGNFKTHFPDSIEYWGVEPNAEARAEAFEHRVLVARMRQRGRRGESGGNGNERGEQRTHIRLRSFSARGRRFPR